MATQTKNMELFKEITFENEFEKALFFERLYHVSLGLNPNEPLCFEVATEIVNDIGDFISTTPFPTVTTLEQNFFLIGRNLEQAKYVGKEVIIATKLQEAAL